MARFLYLVCYDISEPKTLQKMRKLVQAYAIGGQKSFYECWMTVAELKELFARVENLIDLETDRCNIFQLDPRQASLFFGVAKRQSVLPFLVV